MKLFGWFRGAPVEPLPPIAERRWFRQRLGTAHKYDMPRWAARIVRVKTTVVNYNRIYLAYGLPAPHAPFGTEFEYNNCTPAEFRDWFEECSEAECVYLEERVDAWFKVLAAKDVAAFYAFTAQPDREAYLKLFPR